MNSFAQWLRYVGRLFILYSATALVAGVIAVIAITTWVYPVQAAQIALTFAAGATSSALVIYFHDGQDHGIVAEFRKLIGQALSERTFTKR